MVLTEEFQDPVKKIQARYSPINYKDHFEHLTDMKNSPFPNANLISKNRENKDVIK